MPTVLTVGTFDLFHLGHVNLLRACQKLAGDTGLVIVGLNTDEFIEAYKGRPPIVDFFGRAEVLRACRFVDLVIPNMGNEDGKSVILWCNPDLLVIGDDWIPPERYYAQMQISERWLAEHGVELKYVPYTASVSTTALRERVDAASGGGRDLVRG